MIPVYGVAPSQPSRVFAGNPGTLFSIRSGGNNVNQAERGDLVGDLALDA